MTMTMTMTMTTMTMTMTMTMMMMTMTMTMMTMTMTMTMTMMTMTMTMTMERRAVRRGGCKTQKLRFSLACSVEALFTRSECHHELAPMRAHSYVPRYLAMSEG